MALSNFNTRIFSTLKHLSFFKTKLVSHSIKVRSHCNFLKPVLAHVVKIMERPCKKKFLSNCRSAIQVSCAAIRQWLEIFINGFLIRKFLAVGEWWWVLVHISWLVVGGGGWWWIYFGWWWVVAQFSLTHYFLLVMFTNSYRMTCVFSSVLIFLNLEIQKKKCNTNKESTCF